MANVCQFFNKRYAILGALKITSIKGYSVNTWSQAEWMVQPGRYICKGYVMEHPVSRTPSSFLSYTIAMKYQQIGKKLGFWKESKKAPRVVGIWSKAEIYSACVCVSAFE
ncbi:hypothetical protein KPH14_009173 [Odynerus spinipes]|uniref:Uncharacterized protein n=1 Tax=Odynerus spinipes TaxID=1348599 RepID=A0AAD9RNS6_9HYME|nr:hypothetical protein KPH14_009173 [Odynerus spinipes]